MLDVFPRLRDALTRGFLIGEEIAHAKAAKGAKDGKGKNFDYFPKLWDARDVVSG